MYIDYKIQNRLDDINDYKNLPQGSHISVLDFRDQDMQGFEYPTNIKCDAAYFQNSTNMSFSINLSGMNYADFNNCNVQNVEFINLGSKVLSCINTKNMPNVINCSDCDEVHMANNDFENREITGYPKNVLNLRESLNLQKVLKISKILYVSVAGCFLGNTEFEGMAKNTFVMSGATGLYGKVFDFSGLKELYAKGCDFAGVDVKSWASRVVDLSYSKNLSGVINLADVKSANFYKADLSNVEKIILGAYMTPAMVNIPFDFPLAKIEYATNFDILKQKAGRMFNRAQNGVKQSVTNMGQKLKSAA